MSKLVSLSAREVLDSRGTPTVEVTAASGRHQASALVPSGASTGSHEALELRDKDPRRFHGKGVLTAVRNVSTLARKAKGWSLKDQRGLDELLIALDGTPNKSHLGANALLGVSLAFARLAASESGIPLWQRFAACSKVGRPPLLPVPFMNVINGGVHADSGLEFQEMMIVPAGAPTFREAIRMGSEIFQTLRNLLHEKGFSTSVGDEGGFAPRLASHEDALAFLVKAIEKSKYKPGEDVFLALDCAASEFFKNGYRLKIGGKEKTVSSEELINYYEKLAHQFPLISIEDGCSEDDWEGWRLLSRRLGKKLALVGDDLFVTNSQRLSEGISRGIANSILIKLNQIGTVTETIDVIEQAYAGGYTAMVSHRSGETEDTSIAHLAVGLATGRIKTGSLSRSERTAKYNELMRIEEQLGRKAKWEGKRVIP